MTTLIDMTERFARGLAEFAELCMVSARDLVAAQVAATDPAEKAACAGALHKVGRSLRQSMALEAKLRRDLEQAGREAQAQAVRDEEKRRSQRRRQVEATVERLIWTEAETEHIAEGLISELSDLLDEEVLAETFGDEPLEAHIARLLDRLGVTLSAPTPQAQPADAHWRSSA